MIRVAGSVRPGSVGVPDPDIGQAELVSRGREVFLGDGGCARCHGTDAAGALGPNLTDTEWLHNRGDYLAIVSRVFTGVSIERSRSGKVMPPRGGSYISEPDVYAVAAYVWVLGHSNR